MTVLDKIKNFFRKGGELIGMQIYKSLNAITDDPRIKVPAEEYDRIAKAKRYYQDELPKVTYYAMGNKKERKISSINLLKMASQRLASLIFNEQCSIKVDDDALQQILDETFKNEDFYTSFETNLEKWIALGSGAIRPYVEDDKIKLSWDDATSVYPLNANTNKVKEIALTRKIQKVEHNNAVYYTLLEFHQWLPKQTADDGSVYYPYQITNELYKSTDPNSVGTMVPLDTIEEFSGLQPQTTLKNLKKPLFAFYRNAGANNKNFISPLGMGLCDNYWKTVDNVNEVHDGFSWDVKTGYRRITVPRSWVRRAEQVNGRKIPESQQIYWDPDDAVFIPVNARNDDSSAFKDLAINIRVDQYSQAMDFFLREFENEVGLSQGTFTRTASGVQTATEVVTNNSMTYQTRSSYLTQVEKMLDQLVYAIAQLLQIPDLWSDNKSRWTGDIDKLTITPDFNDGVFIDQDAQRAQDLTAVAAGVMPKVEFIMRNYGKTREDAEQWLSEIESEQSPLPPDQEANLYPGENPSPESGDTSEQADTKPDDEQG